MKKEDLYGAYPAIVTPFDEDGTNVDYESLDNLLQVQLKAGVHGIVVCGSTGELATLSYEEYKSVVSFVVSKVNGQIPVVAGIGTNSTNIASQFGETLKSLKVDGILVVTPPYNKPPQRGLIEHFRQIKKVSSLPLIAYNIPGRSALNVTPSTINLLAEQGLIIGVKESSGNMDQVMDLIALCRDKIAILSGEDSLVHALITCGGHGVISATQNVAPRGFVELVEFNKKNDVKSAAEIQLKLLPIVRAMFVETNPIPAKVGLHLQGVIKYPSVRLPLVPAEQATIEKVKSVLL